MTESAASDEEAASPTNRRYEETARALIRYAITEYTTPTTDDREEAWARTMRALDQARAEGQAQERERCAKQCDDIAEWFDDEGNKGTDANPFLKAIGAKRCAAAIRSQP